MDENQLATRLVSRCLAGDDGAWEELVRCNSRRIYNLCFRFTGSAQDAEDLTQEVFLKVYRTLNSYDAGRGSFLAWTTTIARSLLVDQFRKTRAARATDSLDEGFEDGEAGPMPLADQLHDPRPGPEAAVQQSQLEQVVQQALQKLSPELREAVILRDLQDMDYREIAQALGVPEGTVKSRISRGRAELARLLSRTYKRVS